MRCPRATTHCCSRATLTLNVYCGLREIPINFWISTQWFSSIFPFGVMMVHFILDRFQGWKLTKVNVCIFFEKSLIGPRPNWWIKKFSWKTELDNFLWTFIYRLVIIPCVEHSSFSCNMPIKVCCSGATVGSNGLNYFFPMIQ